MPAIFNRKVHLDMLTARSHTESGATFDSVAPRTPAEEFVAGIWSSCLGVERLGIYDNLFAFLVDSISAQKIVVRLLEVFRVNLTIGTLFAAPTVDALVGLLSEMWGGREIVEEIAWTFAQVQRLSDLERAAMLADRTLWDSASL